MSGHEDMFLIYNYYLLTELYCCINVKVMMKEIEARNNPCACTTTSFIIYLYLNSDVMPYKLFLIFFLQKLQKTPDDSKNQN